MTILLLPTLPKLSCLVFVVKLIELFQGKFFLEKSSTNHNDQKPTNNLNFNFIQ